MVELITVIVLLGILSVVILPRFTDRGSYESRGFRDETVALLRYGQKTAIAQRRTVCVAIAPDGVNLTIAATAGATTCSATPPLNLPSTPRGGSGLAGTDFNFLASGNTSGSSPHTLTISGGASDILIDNETGYVR
jgi:MSHA pilin protein MshC